MHLCSLKWLFLVRLVSVGFLYIVTVCKKENHIVSAEIVPDVNFICLNYCDSGRPCLQSKQHVQMVNLGFTVYNNTSWHQNQTYLINWILVFHLGLIVYIYTNINMWLQSCSHGNGVPSIVLPPSCLGVSDWCKSAVIVN